MFDAIGRMSNDAWNEYFSVRKLDGFPNLPFMFVLGIGCFNGIGLALNFSHTTVEYTSVR